MPRVIIKGNGEQEYEYVVTCEECYSLLLCQEDEFKIGGVEEFMGLEYPIKIVYCGTCENDTKVQDHTIYTFPKGMFNIISPVEKEISNMGVEKKRKSIYLESSVQPKQHPLTLPIFGQLSLTSNKRRKSSAPQIPNKV